MNFQGPINSHYFYNPEQLVFNCIYEDCTFKSTGTEALTNHVKEHTERSDPKFKCPTCPKKFSRKKILLVHVHKEHPETKTKNDNAAEKTSTFAETVLRPASSPVDSYSTSSSSIHSSTYDEAYDQVPKSFFD